MAPTRKKRQTKHRGNAAGVVEARGRTGRKPTPAEKRGEAREAAKPRQQRPDRRDQPPSWRGAFVRAMFAAALFLLIVLILFKKTAAIKLFPLVLLMYVPISYYTEKWSYERRMRKKALAASAGKERSS